MSIVRNSQSPSSVTMLASTGIPNDPINRVRQAERRRDYMFRVLPEGAPEPTDAEVKRHADYFFSQNGIVDPDFAALHGYRIAVIQYLLQKARQYLPNDAKKLNDEVFATIAAYKKAVVKQNPNPTSSNNNNRRSQHTDQAVRDELYNALVTMQRLACKLVEKARFPICPPH
jgi:hypothetical protein